MPMLTRAELETPRTPEEMGALLDSFGNDREAYPEPVFRLRQGIVKPILEEYRPLYALARYLRPCSAYLKPRYNQGPDGVVRLATGEKLYVQITVADQSGEEAARTKLVKRTVSQGELARYDAVANLNLKECLIEVETAEMVDLPSGGYGRDRRRKALEAAPKGHSK